MLKLVEKYGKTKKFHVGILSICRDIYTLEYNFFGKDIARGAVSSSTRETCN